MSNSHINGTSKPSSSKQSITRAETPQIFQKRRINTPGLFSGYNSNTSSTNNININTQNILPSTPAGSSAYKDALNIEF